VGVVGQVGEQAKKLGGKKVLVVTDMGVIKAGLLKEVQQSLEDSRINYGVFDKCEPDTPEGVIRNCAQCAKDGSYDLLIGLGGGSSMDTAKLSAIATTEIDITPDIISRYLKEGLPASRLHSIMIPTTAGSGAEISPGVVLTESNGFKNSVVGCLADVAIVDPKMTLNLPAGITADTGFDALSHALEHWVHPKSTLICDALGEMAIKLISENLRVAYYNGPNRIDSRYNMAVGATWSMAAGMASTYVIMNHSLAYPLQCQAKTTHGRSIALLLPHVMEFNLMTNLPKYARLAAIMGENVAGLSAHEAASKSIDAVRNLTQDLNLPQRLRDVGVKKDQINSLVDNLFTYYDQRLRSNPRQVSREDATSIYESAW
jgi:alcohol dehydrogenase class IV